MDEPNDHHCVFRNEKHLIASVRRVFLNSVRGRCNQRQTNKDGNEQCTESQGVIELRATQLGSETTAFIHSAVLILRSLPDIVARNRRGVQVICKQVSADPVTYIAVTLPVVAGAFGGADSMALMPFGLTRARDGCHQRCRLHRLAVRENRFHSC